MTTPAPVTPLGEVKVVPIGSIKPYPSNPRKITDKGVAMTAASIAKFGWQQPVVVDTDGVIVAGHTRHLAAKLLKLAEVPVVVADKLTPDEIRAYRIADNRDHDYATWDYGLLASELDGLDAGFAEVLDLADWQGIIDEFQGGDDPLLNGLDDDLPGQLGVGFALAVVFATKEQAEAAAPGMLEVPGVVNVRYSGR